MPQRLRALLAVVVAIWAGYGCDDSTAIRAQFSNSELKPVVYAMNGTPSTLPAALALRYGTAQRIDANFFFDLAFDIKAAGMVEVYTQSLVASELAPRHRVGLQLSAQPFDAVTRAPTSGYAYDSLTTLPLGQTLLVDVLEQNCANSFLGANIRGKITVDSVQFVPRRIFLHVLVNPNCGFRSLVPGEPKD